MPLVSLAGVALGLMMQLDTARLCVTEGTIGKVGSRLSVNASKMRAVALVATAHAVEIRFTYRGRTRQVSRLGSGRIRQQLGLKLRAADGCNVVYAMWRIAPESELVVSVKHNPTMHQSSECGNRGYQNIKAQHAEAAPRLSPGESHVMRAEMRGQQLTVFIDRRKYWVGSLGPEALSFDGPIGLRSDNVRIDFELFSGAPEPGDKTAVPACADS
ncbi:MAG TPA: hypothetical protein VKR61_16205 [Bryobacteraceae bacterium]|nr:hypothetical protein [Bryobacteraceae bacterium]